MSRHRAPTTGGMRDACEPPVREGFSCASCGRFNVTAVAGLFRQPRAGSPQRFCDPSCRQAAYRRRRAGVSEDAPRQLSGGRRRKLGTTPSQRSSNPPTPDPETCQSTNEEAV